MKMKSRIMSCDHNDEDTIEMATEIAGRMPDGWVGLIIPEGGHPITVLPRKLSDGEMAVLPSDAMAMVALQIGLHDDEFAETLITEIMGDEVERADGPDAGTTVH